MKTHWLYGFGPNKEVKVNVEIDEETDCSPCVHRKICDYTMEKRCLNYMRGTSEGRGCTSCLLRFTRYDKDKIPCFICVNFLGKG